MMPPGRQQPPKSVRTAAALSRIALGLHRFRDLDAVLEFITREVQELLDVEGASVILLDDERQEFYFRRSVFDDPEAGRRMSEVRFPADRGVAGEVLRTGAPMIVNDTSRSPFFYGAVDEKAAYRTRSMLDVPVRTPERMIGVLCAVNRKSGQFGEEDAELLGAVAGLVALPIENARMNEALVCSYEDVRRLNRAKDAVIHRLSHELKTPLAVLSASLNLLAEQLARLDRAKSWATVVDRAQRNLGRILDMQYKIEDLLADRDHPAHRMLSVLLDQCSDELEALAAETLASERLTDRLRRKIDHIFGPRDSRPETIRPAEHVARFLSLLRPRWAHRRCEVVERLAETEAVRLPPEVLDKILEGLVRNAVENTADGGAVTVSVRPGPGGPELEVADTGTGMSEETRRLVFSHFFTGADPGAYSTRRPYDFKAGGRGFDLLRLQILSERYGFTLHMDSRRCPVIPSEEDACPGDTRTCAALSDPAACRDNGGTVVRVVLPRAGAAPAAAHPDIGADRP
jgi:signal transduction histidine kinase